MLGTAHEIVETLCTFFRLDVELMQVLIQNQNALL